MHACLNNPFRSAQSDGERWWAVLSCLCSPALHSAVYSSFNKLVLIKKKRGGALHPLPFCPPPCQWSLLAKVHQLKQKHGVWCVRNCFDINTQFVPPEYYYKFSNVNNNKFFCTACRALRARNFSCSLQLSITSSAACPQGPQLLYMPCPQGSQLSRSKTLCNFPCPQGSQAFRVPETSFPFSSFPAARANTLAKIKDEDTFDTWATPSMHLKISGFLYPYF